ncbi:MAG: CAP domain-containing protein, partial [Patescibacteria group bacterium]|nr:CAP domain-containing protein [Patescibacteria group bacterium]
MLGSFLLANTAFLSSITEEKIIELTNMERKKQNLPALTANQMLAKAAYEKGQDIFATQTFQHNINNNKFSVWIKNANYEYDYVGENLAIDFMTAEGALKAWLESATHKKNILNERFNEIGVAVINGNFEGEDTILIVQIFGTPKILNSALSKNKIKTTEPTVQNEYINTNPLSELTLVNANNGSKALAPATPGAEFDHLNNNINNLLIHFSQLKASAIKSL